MRRRVILVVALVLSLAGGGSAIVGEARATPARSGGAAPAGVIGVWAGLVTQHGTGVPRQTYEVLMAVKATTTGTLVGRTVYPSLNCAGQLQLSSAHGTSYVFREQIFLGPKRCATGGTIFATVSGNSLSWRWVANGVQIVGVLQRAYSNVTITGAVHATLTAAPNQCSLSRSVHTIQVTGRDSGGADVTLTVTDQQKGGWAQILRGGRLYFYKGKGKLVVTPTSATFTDVVMPENDGIGNGTVSVNGTVTC